jgi:hypothetical protein
MRKGVDPGRNAAVLVPGERAGKSFWCRDANGNVAFEFRENNPSLLGLSFTPSQNWADIVLGGRVLLPAGQKASVSLSGDVGGWNATSKLDY